MSINPTLDAETFKRQFARIKARDAERASRIQNGAKLAEMDASRTLVALDAERVRRFRALLDSVSP